MSGPAPVTHISIYVDGHHDVLHTPRFGGQLREFIAERVGDGVTVIVGIDETEA